MNVTSPKVHEFMYGVKFLLIENTFLTDMVMLGKRI